MDKKKAVKLATASAVAASAFVAANPHASQAATDVATVVSQAKAQMKQAYYTYSHTVTETGQFPDINDVYAAYNKAKQAYANAVAVVNKAGGAKKDAYLADLQATYETYVFKANPKSGEARVATYIDAYNYATKLDAMRQELKAAVDAKDLKKAEELYHKISYELKTRTVILDRVYGQTTRELLRSTFKADAQALRDSLIYDITVAMKAREAQDAVKAGNLDKAKAALDQVNQYVSKVTDAFKAELQKAAQDANAAYEAALTPKVESVSAINARELVVKFNKAVDKTEAEKTSNYKLEGETFTSAVLSEDGKTVTLTTADELKVSNAKLTVFPIPTKADANVKTAEFNQLLTFADTEAPAVTSVQAKGTTAVITFAEPLQSEGTVSLNGVELTSGSYTLNGNTLTITGLEAEKSYRVDIVGAKDFAGNTANPIVLNFTVEKPVVDNTKPTVAVSVNGTKVTVDFSEELSKQDFNNDGTLDAYAKVTVGTTEFLLTDAEKDANDKTKFTFDAKSVLGTKAFVNTTVKVESYKDLAGNAGEAYSVGATLVADKTAPSLVSVSSKLLVADDTAKTDDTDVVYLTFNEPVVVNGDFTLTSKNGILYTSATPIKLTNVASGVDVDGNGEIEGTESNTIAISVDLDKNSSYSFKLAGNSVADLSGNKIADDLTINFNTADYQAPAQQPSATLVLAANPVVVDPNNNNVFTVEYATDVTSSALNAANYKLGGAALPAGTQLQFVDGTKKVRITLPAGSIVANGSYMLEIKNVVDTNGNTLKDGKATVLVPLKESVAPVATKITLVDSNTFTVDFSEAIKDAAAGSVTGVTVKINGVEDKAASVSAANGKLTVTTSADFNLSDSITVEFKSANLVDANGNKVKDGVVSK
ncbi:Ig-like domain-containing protein [Geobacillus sp. YHL]|uniref:Ig-like domain-containing protein n=1 Tax=Geobacillus sp. YHL TaxID=2796117 RepID=UPI001EF0F5E6|nr:Ig-like domain-containing protein [Geobacillus sp. YHL]MCG6794580.1 Ig-like domain-containing protein [Geobacillus sp. YHL]